MRGDEDLVEGGSRDVERAPVSKKYTSRAMSVSRASSIGPR